MKVAQFRRVLAQYADVQSAAGSSTRSKALTDLSDALAVYDNMTVDAITKKVKKLKALDASKRPESGTKAV